MATYDILAKDPFEPSRGTERWGVQAGATTINPNEPVVRALGATSVTAMATSKPVVGTDYLVGISQNTSTQTATAEGTVDVERFDSRKQWLVNPTTASSWNTQAKYDALVGSRVVFALSAGKYTLGASDGSTNGVVVMPMVIGDHPGKVAIAFRAGLNDLS